MSDKSAFLINIFVALLFVTKLSAQVSAKPASGLFPLSDGSRTAPVVADSNDHPVILKAARLLAADLTSVTGLNTECTHKVPAMGPTIIVGSIDRSYLISALISDGKLDTTGLKDRWEAYRIVVIKGTTAASPVLVIMGSDRRGAAFGALQVSAMIGVSPWNWWADVPVKKQAQLYLKVNAAIESPKIKYRGIFINDEAPALSGWAKEKFGGFNHLFYEKVFELMLRLKSNYIWPAMWGNAFYDDDSLNIRMADQYAIVIGTSHHEPLMRAHDEWRRYGKGRWDYDSNKVMLKDFWTKGMQSANNEKIVSVGMRGDGDEPMSRQTATTLLERIVSDQRDIITEVTGKPAASTPQIWALYKEVQDYYDQGMRVPDDITLLLCDDNWGNIRRLPKLSDPKRKGGYGIYYHFDYVGGPRNYKWINTNPIARVWEQMHLAWKHDVKDIWIVNVGDIKPMEFPISFFLDYAWNPDAIQAGDLDRYTMKWAGEQFGDGYANDIAMLISSYTKFNGRRKPELLNDKTYSLINYQEALRVNTDYQLLLQKARQVESKLSPSYKDAYYQLVLHPIEASANLQQLYTMVGLNKLAVAGNYRSALLYADSARIAYKNDSLITRRYHSLAGGKWNHMMDQTHIGYTYWQQPPVQKMPALDTLAGPASSWKEGSPVAPVTNVKNSATASVGKTFTDSGGFVSIGADHFTRSIKAGNISFMVLPDHGKTGSAVTSFPVTTAVSKPGLKDAHLEYDFILNDTGTTNLIAYFSPTLNFHHSSTGLRYAVAIDDEVPVITGINAEDAKVRIWESWVANNIIIKTTAHGKLSKGKHTIRYWSLDPGIVLQKLVIDLGGLKPSYLGPPESSTR